MGEIRKVLERGHQEANVVLVWFAATIEEVTEKRKIIIVKPNTTGSPLQLARWYTPCTFCLATEKPQMVVQVAMPWIVPGTT